MKTGTAGLQRQDRAVMCAACSGASYKALQRSLSGYLLLLSSPLEVNIMGDDHVTLMDGGTLVAEARKVALELEVPTPPAYAEAQSASKDYLGFKQHPFPRCFVCGPERAVGDGMRIFPGPVPGGRMVAAPWIPYADLSDRPWTGKA